MIYIASPYSDLDHKVMQKRYEQVLLYTATQIRNRKFVYSPIVHCHEMARLFDMPKDAGFWMEYNFNCLKRCDELHILQIPGWDKSMGVQAEVAFAKQTSIPIKHVSFA